jgi:anti-anti-sigma factor
MLTFETQVLDDVVVIRCKGRIAFGAAVDALQAEVEKHTKIEGTDIYCIKQVVLQLAETHYVDSSGLGALVRMLGVLRAAGGGVKLCQLSPTVAKTLEITNLEVLFTPYASEAAAIAAFDEGSHHARHAFGSARTRIVCVDTSADLLAGLNALLTSSGYEVFTTRFVGEAATLVKATRPKVVICGAAVMTVPTGPAVMDRLRQTGSTLQILNLPSDFHITEAGQAGQELLSQVRSLLAT